MSNDSFSDCKELLRAYLKVNIRLVLDEPYKPGEDNSQYHYLAGKVAACMEMLNSLSKTTSKPVDADMMTQFIKALYQ